MATLEKYQGVEKQGRVHRYFSEDFKRKKVRELEHNLTTVRHVSREYSVSHTSIYKWIYKYSAMRKKGVKMIVEAKSDTAKIENLKQMLKEAEASVGQKQIMIDFLEKMIELTEQEYGIDIKKKFSTRFAGSGSTGKRTR
jgi:transposase